MEALLAKEKQYEARVRLHEKSLAEARESLRTVKAEIAKMKAAEAEKARAEEEAKKKAEKEAEVKKRNEEYKAARAKEEADEKAEAEQKKKADSEKLKAEGRIRFFYGILDNYNYGDGLDDGDSPYVEGILAELELKLSKTSSYPKEVKTQKKPFFYFYGGNGSVGGNELDSLREAYSKTSHSWKMEIQEDDADLSSVKKQKNFLRHFDNGDNMIESIFDGDDEDKDFNPMESGFITYFLTVASKEQEQDFSFWVKDMETAEEAIRDNKKISADTPLTHEPKAEAESEPMGKHSDYATHDAKKRAFGLTVDDKKLAELRSKTPKKLLAKEGFPDRRKARDLPEGLWKEWMKFGETLGNMDEILDAKEKPKKEAKKPEAPITIPKKEFVAEHKELVKVLKEDKPKEVAKEAKKQATELKTTLAKPIEKYKNYEIADMIRERLKKHGKTTALSSLNKAQLLQLYKEVMAKYS